MRGLIFFSFVIVFCGQSVWAATGTAKRGAATVRISESTAKASKSNSGRSANQVLTTKSIPIHTPRVTQTVSTTKSSGRAAIVTGAATKGKSGGKAVSSKKAVNTRQNQFVVAIDAGHGGKDTGAIGPSGILEKEVVFAIARKLSGMITADRTMRAIMVRKGDEFIQLRERAQIARQARADLLVSLHADAYENGEAKGSSVFTLSRSGASSVAARWLADNENAADLVGGVKLKGRGKLLASVLLDLSQNAVMEASDRAAISVLHELEKNNHLHHGQVQKAGFVVLKSPDVPSLLVETAFISTAEEEKRLTSSQYQTSVARSIFFGIRNYFKRPYSVPAAVVTAKDSDADARLVAQD